MIKSISSEALTSLKMYMVKSDRKGDLDPDDDQGSKSLEHH